MQKFFMTEISLGEQLLGVGDIENGIEHLANAVAVTSHKENLLNVLRTTLPDPIFSLLVQKLPEVSRVRLLGFFFKVKLTDTCLVICICLENLQSA